MADINEVISASRAYCENRISLRDLDKIYLEYLNNTDSYKGSNAVQLCRELTEIFSSKDKSEDYYYIISAMFRMTMLPEVYYRLVRSCINDINFTKENRFFAYSQLAVNKFLYPVVNTRNGMDLLDDLYEAVYQDFLGEVKDLCVPIPQKERNRDFIIVLASQVLSLNHGPTKTLLDRCSILSGVIGKKVFIINTCSVLPEYGEILWFEQRLGNNAESLANSEFLEWKGNKYGYFQCPKEMPQTGVIKEILQIVRSEKPYFIVSIGGSDITADMCSRIVPVLTVCLGPSERAQTRTTFQMTGHRINDEDREWLRKHGFKTTHIIEGLFTSDFKPQTSILTREELGLPINAVICIVVGYRLDQEIDETFLDVVRELAGKGIYTAFMGGFSRYEEMTRDDDLLRCYSINLGFKDDALAVYECCDIYLNPKRLGGGTSVAEAMSKGLPAVTINYGDVATGAGDDFIVDDYSEMIERVNKLSEDKDYYDIMSKKAKKRADKLTDSQGEFVRIIHEMESREEFW